MSGLFAATTIMACVASSVAHADYWERRYRAEAATDFAGNVLGVIAGAAAADREARDRRCWEEERRVKVDRNKVVIRRVKVCE